MHTAEHCGFKSVSEEHCCSGRAVEFAQAIPLKLHYSASGDMACQSKFGLTAVIVGSFFGYDGLLLRLAGPPEDNTITFAHSKIQSHLV